MIKLKNIRRLLPASFILLFFAVSLGNSVFVSFDNLSMSKLSAMNSSDFVFTQDPEIPVARNNLMMAYDSQSDLVIIYGGWKNPAPYELNDTWSYDVDDNTFRELSPTVSPPQREVSFMAYDSQSDKMVMFGGIENFEPLSQTRDTWLFDYDDNTWTDVSGGVTPQVRHDHAMAYDSESDRIILFGGNNGTSLEKYKDTWAFDIESNTWELMSPAVAPNERYFHTMAYDSESDRVILFGGGVPILGVQSDVWAYDYNTDTWEELSPANHPVARKAHAMTYDNESDKIVLFGGTDDLDDALGDTWLFDYNNESWTQVNPIMSPSARSRHSMVYDSESNLIIALGGSEVNYRPGEILTDSAVWTFEVNSNNWTERSHLLTPPVETPTTPTSPTTPTGPSGSDSFPIEMIAILGGAAVVIVLVLVVRMRR
ncbi:MAG: Kelch repeat-containing protein [Candidatus Thorarchaeota archaeon]